MANYIKSKLNLNTLLKFKLKKLELLCFIIKLKKSKYEDSQVAINLNKQI